MIDRNHEILSSEEVIGLFKRLEAGDASVRDKLVFLNQRLVLDVAKCWVSSCHTDIEEMFNTGVVGLLHAIDSYDWRRDTKFSTYAYKIIFREIQRWYTYKSDIVKSGTLQYVSLDKPMSSDPTQTLGSFIPSGHNVQMDVERIMLSEGVINKMKEILSKRELDILFLRYGVSDGRTHTLEEVGRKLHLTRARIQQIEKEALGKLRIDTLRYWLY